jgi:hypothetical protein
MSAERVQHPAPCSCGYDGEGIHCHVCHQSDVPIPEVMDHLRSHGYEPERWPDGGIVVVDKTLGPEDFSS